MKAVVCLSGGMDSLLLLDRAVKAWGNKNIACVLFEYGQKHLREGKSAQAIATYYGVEMTTFQLPLAQIGGSTIVEGGDDVPHDISLQSQTVVPGRNLTFLSIAGAFAAAHSAPEIWYAAVKDDYEGYPDCRVEFFEAAEGSLKMGIWEDLRIVTPFLESSKVQMVREGHAAKIPYYLSWSCYEGREIPCCVEAMGLNLSAPIEAAFFEAPPAGCPACQERVDAFQKCGVVDPLLQSLRS